jgi:hypothetical protein
MHYGNGDLTAVLGNFSLSGIIRYNSFVPKLYNLCKSLGFKKGKIMPSRAFCSDENQGFPIILITKHFGTFPFNHGMVGGIIATDRHGPHAHHGKDSVVIHASHVAYDREMKSYGSYRRLQTEHNKGTPTCGKMYGVLDRYLREFDFARRRIFLQQSGNLHLVSIDNSYLKQNKEEGLFLNLNKLIKTDVDGSPHLVHAFSTSKVYEASDTFVGRMPDYIWKEGKGEPIGNNTFPDLFYFKRKTDKAAEGKDQVENNLLESMPLIVTSSQPGLVAAMINTQQEFDRAYRTFLENPVYKGKKVLFISGLNIDISPYEQQIFPLTKFVPWGAFYQDDEGNSRIFEHSEITKLLNSQSTENPDQVDLEEAIRQAEQHEEITIENPFILNDPRR